jgi:hypothetical protein
MLYIRRVLYETVGLCCASYVLSDCKSGWLIERGKTGADLAAGSEIVINIQF